MNIKRIVLVSIILMIAISSLSIVSAGWFDFSSQTTEVNGLSFKVPGGFNENTSMSDNESKVFYKDNDSLSINVYSNDLKKMELPSDGQTETIFHGANSMTGTYSSKSSTTYKNATINNQKGVLGNSSDGDFSFQYTNGTKFVSIVAPDESIINEVMGG